MATQVFYTGDGSTTTWNITFPFRAQGDVKVTVDGVDTAFTWVSASAIQISPAAASGKSIRIYRETSMTNRAVDFTDGSVLTENDLDADSTQAYYRLQELDTQLDDLDLRAMKVPAGESGFTFPSASARANKYLTFGSDGAATISDGIDGETQRLRFVVVSDYLNEAQLADSLSGGASVDMAPAIQEAVNAAGSNAVIVFPRGGTYRLASEITFSGLSNVTLMGHGATVRGGSARLRSYFNVTGASGITIEGFIFDQLKASLPTYLSADYGTIYNCPIYANGGTSRLTVRNNEFKDLYTTAIFFHQSDHLSVTNNIFRSGVQVQDQWLQHIHIQTSTGVISVRNNEFLNSAITVPATGVCAIYFSGVQRGVIDIEANLFDYCARDNTGSHRLGVIDFYGDVGNVRVTNNVAKNTMAQFMRLSSARSAIVTGNHVLMSPNAELDYSILAVESIGTFDPGQTGVQDVLIADNHFEDPGHRAGFAVGVLAYDYGLPSTNVRVLRNAFIESRIGVYVAGPYSNVEIVGNTSRGWTGNIVVAQAPTPGLTSVFGTEANAVYEKLRIEKNDMVNSSGTGAGGVTIDLLKSPAFTGTIRDIKIADNRIRSAAASAGQAIAVQLGASTLQGRVHIVDNETENYTNDWYVRGTKEVIVERNRAIGTSGTPYLDDGSNGYVQRGDNRYSSGPLEGTVTLTAGTATINTTEIRTGDEVHFTTITAGGTPGIVTRGTIVNATSVVANSTSGTDTSTVRWKIKH